MVFIRKADTYELFNVAGMLGLDPPKGPVGLEIEVEGNKFQKGTLPKGWSYHTDNSLRGQDHAEYILTRPIEFKQVKAHLDALWKMFKEYGTVIAPSNRTSVHVHLNVSQFHLNRLTAFMALYFAFEEILTEWCGEHRVGNLFCLRAKDAPAIVSNAVKFIETDMEWKFHEGHHYGGLALDSIRRHGSLEIRTLRGVEDPRIILDWVEILQKLYKASDRYTDPRSICENFSSIGPIDFFESILEERASVIRREISDDFIRQSLYEGVRMYAQDLCYAKDWSTFKPKEFKKDPFGRNKKKTLAQYAVDLETFQQEAQAIQHQTFWTGDVQITDVAADQQAGWTSPFHTPSPPQDASPFGDEELPPENQDQEISDWAEDEDL